MKKNLILAIIYLLTAFQLSSCSKPSDPYILDLSEGKTEIEKTLIINYNNVVETIFSQSEKNKNGEEITLQDILEYQRMQDNFLRYLQDNEYNISHELINKISTNAINMQDKVTEFNNENNKRNNSKVKTSVEYIEKKVNLNDYFNSSTGWDDNTDWEHTGFEDEEDAKAFNEALREKGIYWSDAKGCYVIKVKRTTTEKAPKVQFK